MNRKPGCLRRPRARPGRLALAIATTFALAGCERAAPPPAAPAVDSALLLTIDTWRADHFGAGGHPGVRTPWLDRFFRGGTQFSQAYSCVPTTLASHATMLSGRWPSEHGVPRNGWPLAADVPLLPDSLADVHSGAFVSSAALDPRLGLARAFERYDFEVPHAVEGDQAWRSAGDTLARAREWWRSRAGSRRFLWVHLFEPHFPYAPDPIDRAVYDTGYSGPADGSMRFLYAMWDDPSLLPPAARDHLESLYVAEIAGLDRVVGPFLAEILAEPSLLAVITSDHGESLGEHDLRFKHGPYVYPADVRVPLVLTGTSEFPAGVSDRLVRTID
ncbi:MAG: sulfatase, partial [Gemmatimonadetes bacterium]|nr:sulfatase [Gemmatimonadota bacterium]